MLSAFEQQVSDLARSLVDEYESDLSGAGLRADVVGVRPSGAHGEQATELLILFYRGTDMVDAFEFYVERAGKPVASAQDIESWLRVELTKLVDPQSPQQ
jgi:hypothetical protein